MKTLMLVREVTHPDHSMRVYLSGLRAGLHVITWVTMLGLALRILVGHTLQSGITYSWFLQHWPFTDIGWGIAFSLCAVIGAADWVFPRVRHARLIAALSLGFGHTTFAHGTFDANAISTGVVTYGVLALFSVVGIALTIILDD